MLFNPSNRGKSNASVRFAAVAFLLTVLQSTVFASSRRTPQAGIQPASQTSAPHSGIAGSARMPVIFDDDGSPDGTSALLYLLTQPGVSLKAVNISYGESHPQVYVQHIGRILDSFGLSGIPLGAGLDGPLAGGHDFPDWLIRSAGNYWGLPLPGVSKNYPAGDSAPLMVSILKNAAEPVTVFVSGPCTNLARAMRLDPDIRKNIKAVVIMGGAVHVPGNLAELIPDPANKTAEWNIYVDPRSAEDVFTSGLSVTLVPLDATNQVVIDSTVTRRWRAGGKIGNLSADLYDMLLKSSKTPTMPIWDLMTAVLMVHPDLCGVQSLHVEVITAHGDTEGRTVALQDGKPNVNVCLTPDAALIKQEIVEAFLKSR
jgi:pyrimidine-specific ribonucleoside hydrolase